MNALLTACQTMIAAYDAEQQIFQQWMNANKAAADAMDRLSEAVTTYSATQPTRVTIEEAVAACPVCREADKAFNARCADAARAQRWLNMAEASARDTANAFHNATKDDPRIDLPLDLIKQVKAEPEAQRSVRCVEAIFQLAAKWAATNPLDIAAI